MIWANCLFSFNMSFLLRKVEDVTTISKSQSLTAVSIKDCTFRVPNETTTLFLLRAIIKAIFIHIYILGAAQVGSGDVSARVDGGREGDCRITGVAPLVKDQLDAGGVKVIGRVRSIARVDTRQDRHVDRKSAGAVAAGVAAPNS